MSKMPPNFLNGNKQFTDQPSIPTGSFPSGPAAPYGVFSDEAHDNLIKSKGFKCIHYRHALNPNRETVAEGVNVSDMSDKSGYVFYDPETLWIVPQNISWQDSFVVQGVHGVNSITINYTGYYEASDGSKKRVYIRPGDVLVVEDAVSVLVEELFEFKPGIYQKIKFPIQSVDTLFDGNGRRYEEGVDFIITEGQIQWSSENAPKYDALKKRGAVLSTVYWTKPRFNVIATPRAFRAVWSNPTGNSAITANATYLPGSCVVQMSWLSPGGYGDSIGWPTLVPKS